jgi:hypothetical protein
MKSSDDELNDAIKNALKGSLGNFERKPKVSLDERIYRALGQQPNRKPLWAALGFAALTAVLFLWYMNAGNEDMAVKVSQPVIANVTQKALPDQKKGKSYGKSKGSEAGVDMAAKAPSAVNAGHRIISERPVAPKRKAKNLSESQPLTSPSKPLDLPQKTKLETHRTESAGDQVVSDSFDDPADVANANVKELDLRGVLKYSTFRLPLITVPMLESRKDSAAQNVADKNPAGSWKPAMLVNFSGTNTSQSVYLLPSAHSRILKVSFPNSIANIGYKIGLGVQAKGYQLLLNYSHLQYQTQYVYAIDEFTAEPTNASYNFRRLGMARTVKSKFDIVGVAAKKQFDFQFKSLSALYAQLGMEYSRSITDTDQQLLSASLAVGKRIFAGHKATIVIGPFFEYNILRILTTEENVKVRPNQAGISLGFKFAK